MTMLSGTRLLRTSRGHAGFRLFLDPSQVVDVDGAQGRDRTTDTAIFSRMLYQLSYLGTSGTRERGSGAPVYSQAGQPCPPRFAFGFAWRSPRR